MRNPNRPEGPLGREEREGEEEDGARNGDCQSGTLVLEDTDTGQSIGSSRREYLLLEKRIERRWGRKTIDSGVVLSRPIERGGVSGDSLTQRS